MLLAGTRLSVASLQFITKLLQPNTKSVNRNKSGLFLDEISIYLRLRTCLWIPDKEKLYLTIFISLLLKLKYMLIA